MNFEEKSTRHFSAQRFELNHSSKEKQLIDFAGNASRNFSAPPSPYQSKSIERALDELRNDFPTLAKIKLEAV